MPVIRYVSVTSYAQHRQFLMQKSSAVVVVVIVIVRFTFSYQHGRRKVETPSWRDCQW